MNKPTLPKEVAEAIEFLRRRGKGNRWLVEAAKGETVGQYSRKIRAYIDEDSGNFDVFLSAIVNGYEIEKTPEELVKEYYDELRADYLRAFTGTREEIFADGGRKAIRVTLNTLGITIEGVND